MAGTYRDLLYTGTTMDVATFTARSEGRGYIGHVVAIDVTDDSRHCNCTCEGFIHKRACWHVKEAPKALFYVQQREKFRQMADFPAFFDQWWPRYTPATSEEVYLGKPKGEWEIFFAALLDERNERDAYRRKYAGQVREMFNAVEVME